MALTRGEISDLGDNDIAQLNADSVTPQDLTGIGSTLGKLQAIAAQYTLPRSAYEMEYELVLDTILANQP